MPLHGLSPGNYTLRVTLSLSKEHRQPANEYLPEYPRVCHPESSSFWRLADLSRAFVIEGNNSAAPVVMDIATDEKLSSQHTRLPKAQVGDALPEVQRLPLTSSAVCGSYVDDSEWCIYRPACLDTANLGLVLLTFAPDFSDTSFQLGRKDDFLFVPTSLDRSTWEGPKASNNDLPHRSAALARHLSASSFADAEKRGVVAWFDPGSDNGSSSNDRAGRVGLMFEETSGNIYHAATKALQLSYAAKELSDPLSKSHRGSYLDAVVPLSCSQSGCQPARASHDNAPAAVWLDGLLALLFSNKTTQVIHDPRAWASATHEKTTTLTAGGNKSPVELLCFREVLLPGENRALFRGPADARRFRFNARRYLRLSPVMMELPPKVLIEFCDNHDRILF